MRLLLILSSEGGTARCPSKVLRGAGLPRNARFFLFCFLVLCLLISKKKRTKETPGGGGTGSGEYGVCYDVGSSLISHGEVRSVGYIKASPQ